jgi:hypothetical protein
VLLDAETLEPRARIHYPTPCDSTESLSLCSAGDDTWVTVTPALDGAEPCVPRWRLGDGAGGWGA